jgi:hypothetical protein
MAAHRGPRPRALSEVVAAVTEIWSIHSAGPATQGLSTEQLCRLRSSNRLSMFVQPRQMRQLIEGVDLALVSRAQTFTWSVDVFSRRSRSVRTTLTEGL